MVELVDLDQQAVGATDNELADEPSSVVGLSDLDAGGLEAPPRAARGVLAFSKLSSTLPSLAQLRARRVRKQAELTLADSQHDEVTVASAVEQVAPSASEALVVGLSDYGLQLEWPLAHHDGPIPRSASAIAVDNQER